jgi:hypothetical protein
MVLDADGLPPCHFRLVVNLRHEIEVFADGNRVNQLHEFVHLAVEKQGRADYELGGVELGEQKGDPAMIGWSYLVCYEVPVGEAVVGQ